MSASPSSQLRHFRISSRATGHTAWLIARALLLAFVAACTDAAGPHAARVTRIAIHPSFARGQTATAQGLPVNRIVVTARETETGNIVGDVDRAVDPDAGFWDMDLVLTLSGSDARDVALAIELAHDDVEALTVEWSAIVIVAVTPGHDQEVDDVVLYPGPLAPVASVAVLPSQANVPVNGTLILTAVVRDSQDNVLTRLAQWNSSNADVATVSSSGVVNGETAGSATITATVEGVSGSATVDVYVPAATSLAIIGGDDQTGTVTQPLAEDFVVRVLDQHGNGVSGHSVSWTVSAGGGSIAPPQGATDAGGFAAARLTLGANPGEQTAQATAAGIQQSVTFSATAEPPGDAALVEVTPDSASMVAGDTLRFTAEVKDAGGVTIDSAAVAWSTTDTLRAQVNADGLVIALDSGDVSVVATSGAAADTADLHVTLGPAKFLGVWSGEGQGALAGDTLPSPIVVVALDNVGNGIAGVPVQWSVVSGGGSLDVSSTVTGPGGLASARWTLGPSAGGQVAQAVSAGLIGSPLQFHATAGGGSATRVWVGGAAADPTSWAVAANWNPAGVPNGADTVVIPAVANLPRLVGDASVGALEVQAAATFDDGGYTLTVNGDLFSDGFMLGTGVVSLTGSGAQVRGNFSHLTIQGTATAAGPIGVVGGLSVVSGNLTANGQTISVGGGFQAGANGGTITMTNPADALVVQGTARFENVDETGLLTAGVISVAGSFVTGCYKDTEFVSTGTTVVFAGDGSVDQIISICPSAAGRFFNVYIAPGARVVTDNSLVVVDSALFIGGTLVVGPAAVVDVQGPPQSLELGDSSSVLDNSGVVKANLPIRNDNGGTVIGNPVVQR